MLLPWYDDTGPAGGAALVLLHAFPLSSATYDALLPHLRGARVLRIDLPGLGRSVSSAVGRPSVAAMADAVAAVLHQAGADRVVVVGTSTGGYVALELAARHPDLVAALVLGSTTTRVIEPDLPADRYRLADDLAATGNLQPLVDGADAGLGPTAQREQPDLLPTLHDVVRRSDPRGVAWVARAIAGRRDTSTVLAAFDGPVLLLFGGEDTETPPERALELAAIRAGRPTRTVVLAATGHLTAFERPADVGALLRPLAALL